MPLKYLQGYPPALLAQVRALIDAGRLAQVVAERHPEPNLIRSERALYEHVCAMKARHMRSAPPLAKVVFDPQLHILKNALGTHTAVSRVQGRRLEARREIRIATLFRDAPADFMRMIVVHELAHLKERAHDKAFYALCLHMAPDYHQLEFDLRLWLTAQELPGAAAPQATTARPAQPAAAIPAAPDADGAAPATRIDAATRQAYRETDYRVQDDPPFTLHIGEPSPALAAAQRQQGVDCSAYVSACNPLGQRLAARDNAARHAALGRELADRGLAWREGIGQHPVGDWPGEPSYLVFGLDLDAARRLGQRLAQNAIVWSGADARPQLVLLR